MKTIKLQEDVRLIASGGTKDRPIYLVEEAPRHRLASYYHGLYHLPLPWVYYVVIYSDVESAYPMFGHNLKLKNKVIVHSVYCSPKKIRSDEDYVDWLPVANSAPHQVCDYGIQVKQKSSRLQLINDGVNAFWSANGGGFLAKPSKLQIQISPSLDGPQTRSYHGVDTYADWEKLSIDDMLALSYENLITIGEIRKRVLKDEVELVSNFRYL